METNANEVLLRASSWGKLVTNDKKGTGLGAQCKQELVKIYAQHFYGRREEITSKYLEKGNEREEDSITLLSRVTKTMYKKNTVRLKNEFVSGEPDLYLGKSINEAEETNDTKSSWSFITFLLAKAKCEAEEVFKGYYWQGQTYMWLTGAKKHTVSYCLVNATHKILSDELRKLAWKLNVIDINNPPEEFIKKAQQIERNHIFDRKHFEMENPGYDFYTPQKDWFLNDFDIPFENRLAQVSFERNEKDIEFMIGRTLQCRSWINQNLINK